MIPNLMDGCQESKIKASINILLHAYRNLYQCNRFSQKVIDNNRLKFKKVSREARKKKAESSASYRK